MGLFVAEMILNIEHVSFPILRTFFLILMLMLFVFTLLTEVSLHNYCIVYS